MIIGRPIIMGKFSEDTNANFDTGFAVGAFTLTDLTTRGGVVSSAASYRQGNITFSAGNSNAIYGASETVQPQSLRALPLIKF